MAVQRDMGSEENLDRMPSEAFVAVWRTLVGEPPAIMLASRSEMIRLLVQSVPPAGPGLSASPEPRTAVGGRWPGDADRDAPS